MVRDRRTPVQRIAIIVSGAVIAILFGAMAYLNFMKHQTLSRLEGEVQSLETRLQSLRDRTRLLKDGGAKVPQDRLDKEAR
jgi:hypothetical protein